LRRSIEPIILQTSACARGATRWALQHYGYSSHLNEIIIKVLVASARWLAWRDWATPACALSAAWLPGPEGRRRSGALYWKKHLR